SAPATPEAGETPPGAAGGHTIDRGASDGASGAAHQRLRAAALERVQIHRLAAQRAGPLGALLGARRRRALVRADRGRAGEADETRIEPRVEPARLADAGAQRNVLGILRHDHKSTARLSTPGSGSRRRTHRVVGMTVRADEDVQQARRSAPGMSRWMLLGGA